MDEKSLAGMEKAKAIYGDRFGHAMRMKQQGKQIMGYLCIHPPAEMMTALDLVPFRIFGDMRETVTKADAYLPAVVCPFLRSLLDVALKGRYDFLDGVTFVHTCDVGAQFAGNWKINIPTPFSHFIDMPHTTHEGALEYFKGLLKDYQTAMELHFNVKMTPEKLGRAIDLHNQQRELVRRLYELRKADPPLISGSEVLKLLVALMSLPVEEGNLLLTDVMDEIRARDNGPLEKSARLLVWGSIIDDAGFMDLVESLDAHVVMDDSCVGTRAYFSDLEIIDDPLEGLARHYLTTVKCPRTFQEKPSGGLIRNYREDLESRFGYLGDFVRDFNVNGVILQALRYCDAHGYEVPGIRDYLKNLGIPSIYIEHNYTAAAFEPLRTRIQGFVEMIES
jgi:benzoyl-CoA reductase subunit C